MEVDVDIDRCCSKAVSKSVQILLNSIEAVIVLNLIVLK